MGVLALALPCPLSSKQLLTVDRSARGSMKTAAKCVSACESQDYQMHRPVERTLRRRYYPVMSPLPDECLLTPSIHPLPAGGMHCIAHATGSCAPLLLCAVCVCASSMSSRRIGELAPAILYPRTSPGVPLRGKNEPKDLPRSTI